MNQANTEAAFKLPQTLRDGRSRHVHAPRGFGQGAAFGERDKKPQVRGLFDIR
jgi:hypothetical protein